MLEVAGVREGEVVYDLGAGDGRILVDAVRTFEARAVGVEDNPKRLLRASRNLFRSGVADKARLVNRSFFDVDLGEADVVTLYLLPETNRALLPKLRAELKRSARIVAHDFPLPGVEPTLRERVNYGGVFHYIYLYGPFDQDLVPKRF
jgi:precorrin-6B methylase 2